MKKYKQYQEVVSVLLSFVVIIFTSGCFSVRSMTRNEIQYTNKKYYCIHGQNEYFRLKNISISGGQLSGSIDYVVLTPAKDQVVDIYVAPDNVIKQDSTRVTFPVSNIAKVETNTLDGPKTALFVVGTISMIAVTAIILILLFKGASCPFIYASDGNSYSFNGEIYSGATARPLERNDYLPVNYIKPDGRNYRLRITNEVKEIQNTNLTELVVYDHKPGTDVLMDKYGNAYSVTALKKPIAANDMYGNSIIKQLSCKDSLRYISPVRNDQKLYDTISLKFEKPAAAKSAKLVVKAKNTMWLDFMYLNFTDLFGDRLAKWNKKRDRQPGNELFKWTTDQGMPLAVYVSTATGLKLSDYYNIPGPMADKVDILPVDISDVAGNILEIKLVSGVFFWDIDYVGIDFTDENPPVATVVKLKEAVDENGKNVTGLLLKDDARYLVQPATVNKTDLLFEAPEIPEGLTRTIYLHSKGHYDILRDTKGKPDIAYLRSFREPGAFIKYSKDHFIQYYYTCN